MLQVRILGWLALVCFLVSIVLFGIIGFSLVLGDFSNDLTWFLVAGTLNMFIAFGLMKKHYDHIVELSKGVIAGIQTTYKEKAHEPPKSDSGYTTHPVFRGEQ